MSAPTAKCPACGESIPIKPDARGVVPTFTMEHLPDGTHRVVSAPTLVEFLHARIADDEVVARAATPGQWSDLPMGSEGSIVTAGGNTIHTARKPATCGEFGDATHIALHDPARVLAECQAKRAIIEQVSRVEWAGYAVRDFVLQNLAAVYADHEDFREEWRP